MSHEFTSAADFNEAVEQSGATPHDPIPGDGRQYYSGQDQGGETVNFCEDNTGPQTRYFKF